MRAKFSTNLPGAAEEQKAHPLSALLFQAATDSRIVRS
jgi:hypothetical protein